MNTGSKFPVSGAVSDDPNPKTAMIETIAITIGTT
jgi:hypothetical protein